jgi:hypothetical protein
VRFGNFIERFRLMTRLAALAAQKIIDEIPRDAAKPRAQFFRLAQSAKLLPRGDKRFLREVFALAQAARRAERERADERLVARDNLPEGVTVPRQRAADQFRIIVRRRRHNIACHHIVA